MSNAVLDRIRHGHALQEMSVHLSFVPAGSSWACEEALPEDVLKGPWLRTPIGEHVYGQVVRDQEQFVALELFLAKWGDPYLKKLKGCHRVLDQEVLLMLDSEFSCRQLSECVGAWFSVPVANAFVIGGDRSVAAAYQNESLGQKELERLADLTKTIYVMAFDGDGFIRFNVGGSKRQDETPC